MHHRVTHTQVCTLLHAALDTTVDSDQRAALLDRDKEIQDSGGTLSQRIHNIIGWLITVHKHELGVMYGMDVVSEGLPDEALIPIYRGTLTRRWRGGP